MQTLPKAQASHTPKTEQRQGWFRDDNDREASQ